MKINPRIVITIFIVYYLLMVIIPVGYARLYVKPATDTNVVEIAYKTSTSATLTFQITDSSSQNVDNALIIIQGITDSSFSAYKFTDSNGLASFSLDTQKLYQWTVYKTGYTTQTGFVFVINDQKQNVALEAVAPGKWYDYIVQDSNMRITMNVFDTDTYYNTGESRNFQIETTNIGSKNVQLDNPNILIKTVDAGTNQRLRWWGTIYPQDIKFILTLKPNGGWIRITSKDGAGTMCTGNSFGTRLDTNQNFDLSGSEYICINNDALSAMDMIIPEWIPTGDYKIISNLAYIVDGSPNNIDFTTQNFHITRTSTWLPDILSSPTKNADVGQEYSYKVSVDSIDSLDLGTKDFYTVELNNAPKGMYFDYSTSTLQWTPGLDQQGSNKVNMSVVYYAFDSQPQKSFAGSQTWNIYVKPLTQTNLYPSQPYMVNNTAKILDNIILQFKISNTDNAADAVNWIIDKGDGTTITGATNPIPAGKDVIVWTMLKYSNSGQYNPVLTVNPDKKIIESDYSDNTINLGSVDILGSGSQALIPLTTNYTNITKINVQTPVMPAIIVNSHIKSLNTLHKKNTYGSSPKNIIR